MANNFTVIRLVLALMVVVAHSYEVIGISNPITLAGRGLGNFAVQGFFVISGYLVTGSYISSSGPLDFATRRAFRILPALVVAMVISTALWQWHAGYSGLPLPYSNASVWTLSWEVLAYALVLLLGVLGLLTREVAGATLVVGAVLIFSFITSTTPAVTVIAPLAFMFCAGAYIRLSGNRPTVGLASLVALAVISIDPLWQGVLYALQTVPFVFGPDVPASALRWYCATLAIPMAALYLAEHAPIKIVLRNDFSYGAYLFAWPIQQMIATYGPKLLTLTPSRVIILSSLLSILAGAISWHVVEKPFMQLRRRLSFRTTPAEIAPEPPSSAPVEIEERGSGITARQAPS